MDRWRSIQSGVPTPLPLNGPEDALRPHQSAHPPQLPALSATSAPPRFDPSLRSVLALAPALWEAPATLLMNHGLFIVLEGIDGTGKSTQTRLLADWFRQRGREVVASREPTDGPWGAKLRATAATGRLPAEDELQLLLRDRREHVEQLIAPALAAGKVVILDRYYFSTMAYQGSRGLDPAEIRRVNEAFAPRPDLLFILDLDVESALSRIGGRGDTANEFEKSESLAKCRDIFLSLADEPFVHLVPSTGGLDAVQARLREIAAAHA